MSAVGTPGAPFDDLAFDYAAGQALEALSILESRGDLPSWAGPQLDVLAGILEAPGAVPAYMSEAADKVCRSHGYQLSAIIAAMRNLAAQGPTPGAGLRTLLGFIGEWRKEVRAVRPPPKFTARGG